MWHRFQVEDSKSTTFRKIKVKIDTVNQWDSGHPLNENNNPLWSLAGQCDVGIGQFHNSHL